MDLLSNIRLRPSETDKRRKIGNLRYDYRLPIESDYGRLVFSSAFRRLHDKTQVFPLTENDNIHSRLTHSVEVASVGKSFALNILKDSKIRESIKFEGSENELWRSLTSLLEVICLSHDIGNPPLGHFGETAIKTYFQNLFHQMNEDLNRCDDIGKCTNPIIKSEIRKCGDEVQKLNVEKNFRSFLSGKNKTYYDYVRFDGNAEGFRVLTKIQFLNDLYGLNLTSASLAAFLKYPNIADVGKEDNYIGTHKHGVFATEKDIMNEVMYNCGLRELNDSSYIRHPFSYLMEASDSICYLLMDLEDALGKGWMKYQNIVDLLSEMDEGLKIVQEVGNHFRENDQDKKKIVQLRSELISYFSKYTFEKFSDNYDDILSGSYNKELLFETNPDNLATKIKKYSIKHVYSNKEIENLELTGNAVIKGLFDYYISYLFHESKAYRTHCKHIISKTVFMTTLQEHLDWNGIDRKAWNEYDDFDPENFAFEEKLRIIRDHIACMTDTYAVEQYRKLSGQKI